MAKLWTGISGCDESEFMLVVHTDDETEGATQDDWTVLSDAFQDEWGVRPEVTDGDGLFEIVAVPDDVASQHDKARDDGVCLDCYLDGGSAEDICDEFENPAPRRVR